MKPMPSLRVLAVAGGRFDKGPKAKAPIAYLYTEGIQPLRLRLRWVEVDGLDATRVTLEVMKKIHGRLDVLMAASIPIAGFNLIDPMAIHRGTGVPVIFTLDRMPDNDAVVSALRRHFGDWEARVKVIRSVGKVIEFPWNGDRLLLECLGIHPQKAKELVKRLLVFGRVPEPLRIAGMAARSLGWLESKG